MGFLIPGVQEAPPATYFRYRNWDTGGNQVHILCKETSIDSVLSPLVCQQITPGTQKDCGRNGNQPLRCSHPYDQPIQVLLPCSTFFIPYTSFSFQNNEVNKCTCRQGLESWHSIIGKGVSSTECESNVLSLSPISEQAHSNTNEFCFK